MRHSMPIPNEKSTPEEWLAYANWLRFTENTRLAKKVALFRETGNYVAVEDFLFEIEENEKEAKYIENIYAPIIEYDAVLNGNVFRKGHNRKAQKNGKRNADKAKRLHKTDRYHGKSLEPYLYKEDGEIKESIEIVWHKCRMPISDKVHNHSALKADAREQDYFLNSSISEMKIEEEENRITEEENRILDNHYVVEDMLSDLKEGKYIFLLSYWNGMGWECSDDATNEFRGILTSEEVKDAILSEQARHLNLVKTEKEIVRDMSGISFTWKGYYDLEDECGYTKFTFLPIN